MAHPKLTQEQISQIRKDFEEVRDAIRALWKIYKKFGIAVDGVSYYDMKNFLPVVEQAFLFRSHLCNDCVTICSYRSIYLMGLMADERRGELIMNPCINYSIGDAKGVDFVSVLFSYQRNDLLVAEIKD